MPGSQLSDKTMILKSKWFMGAGISGVLVILFVVYQTWLLIQIAPIGLGAAAKIACSNIFISGRSAATVLEQELGAARGESISLEVDRPGYRKTDTVRTSALMSSLHLWSS